MINWILIGSATGTHISISSQSSLLSFIKKIKDSTVQAELKIAILVFICKNGQGHIKEANRNMGPAFELLPIEYRYQTDSKNRDPGNQ